MHALFKVLLVLCVATALSGGGAFHRAAGQAGRRVIPSSARGTLVNVFAIRADGATDPVTARDVPSLTAAWNSRLKVFLLIRAPRAS